MGGYSNCIDCAWCIINNHLDCNRVCCNTKSPNYNKVFSKEEAEQKTCDKMESQQAIDYREMTPFEFASKYYR